MVVGSYFLQRECGVKLLVEQFVRIRHYDVLRGRVIKFR